MEMESATQQTESGTFASAWGWLRALPCSLTAKVTSITKSIKKLGQDDPRRVTHSLKVGLALTLVSLLYYARPLYDGFGVSGMWAVLTVVVVFEFTVGATLSKGLNRGLATLFAGALGVGAQHLAILCGDKGEPIVLGILVFILAAASTFTRFSPRMKARYDYGISIFILTFSLVAVSGYRVDELLVLSLQRLSTILIGGATCIVISIFVCPVWAGEDLHKLIASNFEKLACFLEGFGDEYFQENKSEEGGDVTKKDKSFLQNYKTVLNSKTQEDNLANFARWEPGHGKFRLRHPWQQYLKIGALARQCAYQIEALNGYIDSNIQVPQEIQSKIQESCEKISSESSKALRALASSIKKMIDPSPANSHVEASKKAVKDLKIALKEASLNNLDLQAIAPAATVASTLIEIVKCIEKISGSVTDLSNLAHFKKVEPNVSPEGKASHLLHRGSVNPVLDGDSNHVVITIDEETDDSPETEKNQNPKAQILAKECHCKC